MTSGQAAWPCQGSGLHTQARLGRDSSAAELVTASGRASSRTRTLWAHGHLGPSPRPVTPSPGWLRGGFSFLLFAFRFCLCTLPRAGTPGGDPARARPALPKSPREGGGAHQPPRSSPVLSLHPHLPGGRQPRPEPRRAGHERSNGGPHMRSRAREHPKRPGTGPPRPTEPRPQENIGPQNPSDAPWPGPHTVLTENKTRKVKGPQSRRCAPANLTPGPKRERREMGSRGHVDSESWACWRPPGPTGPSLPPRSPGQACRLQGPPLGT